MEQFEDSLCSENEWTRTYAYEDMILYGAYIYSRQQVDPDEWNMHLLCAKSRAAPTKTLTIPRLKLSDALSLVELLNHVAKATGITLIDAVCWCDSTVALSCIRGIPSQWKTYVHNWVTQIIEAISAEHQQHVGTSWNTADPLSRGLTIKVF